ncbi:MAG: GNAT family N-acetyltransferase [Defluviitaleaceae bacterium]|nr:GNAT family N-acetyltransferase [Defluviitaleaceae bacterium]
MIEYRRAVLADAEELARIRSVFIAEVNDLEPDDGRVSAMKRANLAYFTSALADGSFIAWLAVHEDEIVATSGLSFSIVPPNFACMDGRVAYIMNMFTFPAYRGQGIATELFARIAEEAKSLGYGKITLNATDTGRPIYEKYGFKDMHGEMEYYV